MTTNVTTKVTCKYGIRKKGEELPLTYYTESNEGSSCCVDTQYMLNNNHNEYEDIWLVDKEEYAKKALRESTPWFNADYDTPTHYLEGLEDQYEIVRVLSIITVEAI